MPALTTSVVQLGQGPVQAGEAVAKLGLVDDQRWSAMQQGWPEEPPEALVEHGLPKFLRLRGLRILVCPEEVAIGPHQVQATEKADGPGLANAVVLRHELAHLLHHDWPECRGFAGQVLFHRVFNTFVGTGHGHRVIGEGGTPAQGRVHEEVTDSLPHAKDGDRLIGSGQALGGSQNVRDHSIEVLKAPKLSSATETNHDLVKDQEDAVLVAYCTHTLHV